MKVEKIKCDICSEEINGRRSVFERKTAFGFFDQTYDICDECLNEIKMIKARKDMARNDD